MTNPYIATEFCVAYCGAKVAMSVPTASGEFIATERLCANFYIELCWRNPARTNAIVQIAITKQTSVY